MSDLGPEVHEWIERFAAAVGTDVPSDAEVEQLLELAAIAAHASARQAAPVSCWLAARAGVSINTALSAAKKLTQE